MHEEILKLTPKSYRCPFCGNWHDWELSGSLGDYNSIKTSATLKCIHTYEEKMDIFFSAGNCYCRSNHSCIDYMTPIEVIPEKMSIPTRMLFAVPFAINNSECYNCNILGKCYMFRNAKKVKKLALGFEFYESDYEAYLRKSDLKKKQQELEQKNKEQKELEQKEQISKQTQIKVNREDTTMENNIFNMNMEFGQNKDKNIRSTLMGVAVKNGDSWRIYDKNKKVITDVGDIQLGNLPIFILPTTKLSEGDLIKDNGKYYFVTKVANSKTLTQVLSVKTGEMKSIVPIKNVLGFSCYSKVIALSDSLNIGDDFDVEKLAIMSAMCGQTSEEGNQMNQLLLMMLFKDKLGGDNDMKKLLIMSSMMNPKSDNTQMNQLLPMMLFKDKLIGDDDTMKLLLISSMTGGNTAGFNKLPINYLMLDALMDKKEEETTKMNDYIPTKTEYTIIRHGEKDSKMNDDDDK